MEVVYLKRSTMKLLSIRFCGFGGQGIILSAVILGTAAVIKRNLYAVQTQSYGSEARGGQCQSELIVSNKPINSPTIEKKDILVAMFQTALEKYLPTLRTKGKLIVDSKLVKKIPPTEAIVYKIPATETAIKLGNRIVANMVILGFIQHISGLITRNDLVEVIANFVPDEYLNLNIKAVDAGIEFAKRINFIMEE